MEIKKFVKYYYDDEETTVFIKDGEKRIIIRLFTDNDLRYSGEVQENEKIIATTWKETVQIYHEYGCSKVENETEYVNSQHWDDDDDGEAAEEAFDEAVAFARNWLYPERVEEEKAAKEAEEKARKEREAAEAAEAARKAAEEKARLETYGDEQDVAVLQVLYKALQQSKKPKMLISYAARFCPRFKSGRFEQPRTIIRAGGREYAFQFGYGWERIY